MSLDENGGRIVRVHYHRTVNIGDFNSLQISAQFEEYLSIQEVREGGEAALMDECKEFVRDEIRQELKQMGKIK